MGRTSDLLRRAFLVALLPALAGAGQRAVARPPRLRLRPGPELVAVEGGWLRGERRGDAVAFLGVPYAAPPLGGLRWRPPQQPLPWPGVRDARVFSPACPQLDENDGVIGDEDCLYLNVWTPWPRPGPGPLPVMAFIHGGGHVQGSATATASDGSLLYDGANLAARAGAVVVTLNYRLGALGFVAHPALAAESPAGSSGNDGTRDAIAALAWLHRNAAAFAGDPARVLVFGESAGAVETCMVLVSPLAAGLFSAALMESGACVATPRADALAFGETFAAAAGCGGAADVPACLRALPAAAVILAIPAHASVSGRQSGFQPTVDGEVVPDLPELLLEEGRHNRVPLVVGANASETGRDAPPLLTEDAYRAAVLALVGGSTPLADAIVARYPVAEYGTPRKAYVALTSDAKFVCTARRATRAAARGQSEPVWRYLFAHALQGGGALLESFGAFHGIEIPFVFDHLGTAGYTPTAEELALRDTVVASWAALAASADPSTPAFAWPPWNELEDPYARLDEPPATGAEIRTEQCDFWDSLVAAGQQP